MTQIGYQRGEGRNIWLEPYLDQVGNIFCHIYHHMFHISAFIIFCI